MTSPRGGVFAVVVIFGLSFVGYFKGTPVLTWLPVDATLLFALGATLVVLMHWRTRGSQECGRNRVTPLLGWLWVLFGLGVVPVLLDGVDSWKSTYLYTITLVSWLAVASIPWNIRLFRIWLSLHLAAALAIATMLAIDPAEYAQEAFGRIVLESSSSIGSSRVLGAAIVVVAVSLLFPKGSSARILRSGTMLWFLTLGLAVALLSVGSRGPVVGLLAALLIVVWMPAVRRSAGPRQVPVVLSFVAAAVAAASFASEGAVRRILDLVGSRDSSGRETLWGISWSAIQENPSGIGWGQFGTLLGLSRTAGEAPYSHNMVLEVALEAGWPAAIWLLILMGLVVVWGFRSQHPVAPFMLALAVFWAVNAMFSGDVNGNRVVFVSFALVGACLVPGGSEREHELRPFNAGPTGG